MEEAKDIEQIATIKSLCEITSNADNPHDLSNATEPTTKKRKLSENKEHDADTNNLRQFQRIPIFIVDYHNDVLEFIYKCLATRHLPFENNTLIHFDSHPDMVISREIPASASYDKETMLGELSIENWIMPCCYTGHFNRVVWLKNSWCNQMPLGKYEFQIGHRDDKICVDSSLDYFVSEGNFCKTSELENARDVELFVVNADQPDKQCTDPKTFFAATTEANKHYILDIDLDFFSTSNPFLEIYKEANCYEQLCEIFNFNCTKDATDTTEKRKQQLEALKAIFEYLEENRTLNGMEAPDQKVITPAIYDKIKQLVESLQTKYADDEIDWLLIFDSGSTTDTNGLPHHISSETELETYYSSFKEFLLHLPHPPVLVTIARSAEDDYCPQNQVNCIQERVIKILLDVFGDKIHEKPIMYYLDEEWDVMKM